MVLLLQVCNFKLSWVLLLLGLNKKELITALAFLCLGPRDEMVQQRLISVRLVELVADPLQDSRILGRVFCVELGRHEPLLRRALGDPGSDALAFGRVRKRGRVQLELAHRRDLRLLRLHEQPLQGSASAGLRGQRAAAPAFESRAALSLIPLRRGERLPLCPHRPRSLRRSTAQAAQGKKKQCRLARTLAGQGTRWQPLH
mmetsp:Transcript_28653/g.81962  ORF Transcript_28653/g.81962 Transcript_28653/m.81962 type:complete len:201 (+) Transcript_28653:3581-4183(+)